MVETNGTNTPAAAAEVEEKPRSLREVAEAAWQEIEDSPDAGADDDVSRETPDTGQEQRTRDNLGRFVSPEGQAKPGEQPDKDPARPDDPKIAPPVAMPEDPAAPKGDSSQPPQHWSQQDRETFAKLPKEGQEFLLRRHNEMERDYQGKVQANATAVQFTQAVAPVFEHQAVRAALVDYQSGAPVHPVDAIKQWASFHVRARSPDMNVRADLLKDLAQRMELNPAAVFGQDTPPPPGLTEQDLADPAIKYFADTVGKTMQELNALRGDLQSIRNEGQTRQSEETLRAARWGIDQFAEEKDSQGNLRYPHFDAVLPQMVELFRANPQRELKEAYETAVWMNPAIRTSQIDREKQAITKKQENERAALAARGNLRGRTSPVSKPSSDDGKPKGLRATLQASADEVGL